MAATSNSVSFSGSSPVISQSTHTSRSRRLLAPEELDAIFQWDGFNFDNETDFKKNLLPIWKYISPAILFDNIITKDFMKYYRNLSRFDFADVGFLQMFS